MIEPARSFGDSEDKCRKSYQKIGRIYNAIKDRHKKFEFVKYIIQTDGDINYEFSEDQGVQLNLLFVAHDFRNLDAFKLLLYYGADFTRKNDKARTIVHEIIYTQNIHYEEQEQEFLHFALAAHVKFGNFINPSDENGFTHFHATCMRNNASAVELFLKNGVDVNLAVNADSTIFPSYSPLHLAAKFGSSESADVLLKYGANVHLKNVNGLTPIHLIISVCTQEYKLELKFKKTLKVLLKFLMNNLESAETIDDFGISKFHLACLLRDEVLVERLLEHVEVGNENQSVNLDSPVCPGFTALHFAAFSNFLTFDLLLENGADIESKDARGNTPFDLCLSKYTVEDIFDIIWTKKEWKNIVLSDNETKLVDVVSAMDNEDQLILLLDSIKSSAADIFVPFDAPLWPGYTILHLAVMFTKGPKDAKYYWGWKEGNIVKIDACLKRGADVRMKDANGSTALHLAFYTRKLYVIDYLLQHYDKPENPLDKDNLSFFHIACAVGHEKSVEHFLSTGVDVNCPTNLAFKWPRVYSRNWDNEFSKDFFICPGSTALHINVANGNYEITKMLLEHGADVNAQDVNGFTAAHRLLSMSRTYHDNAYIHKWLSSDDMKNIITDGGLSRLHVACFFGHFGAIDKLLKLGADINAPVTYKGDANVKDHDKFSSNLYGNPREPLFFLSRYTGCTPLHFSLLGGAYKTASLLIENNANVFVKNEKGVYLLQNLLELESNTFLYAMFIKNIAIQTFLEDQFGITKLHLACYLDDVELVEELLSNEVNVNAKVNSNSPVHQGCTALHLVVEKSFQMYKHSSFVERLDKIVRLLIEKGADMFAMDNNNDTVFHLFIENRLYSCKPLLSIALFLFENIKNYNLNPTNKQGLSVFHVACTTAHVMTIESFLNHNNVDVSQAVSYFADSHCGSTALHLVIEYCWPLNYCTTRIGLSEETFLRIVDTLLEKGADINATDVYGNTPLLHLMILNEDISNDRKIINCLHRVMMEKLLSNGADVHARNIQGNTLLDLLLMFDGFTWKDVELLLRFGFRFNIYNPITQEGCLAMFLHSRKMKDEFFQKLIDNLCITKINDVGRTAVHNIVSSKIIVDDCEDMIKRLLIEGCDIDHQDNEGKTALHIAVTFENREAISGLLMNGANINITDRNGKTAFGVCLTLWPNDHSTIKIFLRHIYNLEFCGIPVNSQNNIIKENTLKASSESDSKFKSNFHGRMEKMKNIQIGNTSMSVYEFLIGTDMDVVYTNMTNESRREIDKLYENMDIYISAEIDCLVKLKYKGTIERIKLIEQAMESLNVLIKYRLPDLCCRYIINLLNSQDLKRLIASLT